jgi:MFS family permease
MAVYVVASFACAFSPNIGLLIAFRFVQGFVASAGIEHRGPAGLLLTGKKKNA